MSTTVEPLISVITPTHNRRALLEKKLRALARPEVHGNVAFEVIVVLDNCTDDTEAFLQRYATKAPYPLHWLTTPGVHAAGARNAGARRAAGTILLFSDDDAIPGTNWLAANADAHHTPHVVAVSRLVLPPHLTHGATISGVHGWWVTSGASTSLTKALFTQVGGYDETFSTYGGEDPELGWRLHQAGAKHVFLGNTTVEHWDEQYEAMLNQKAYAAGYAHVRVWKKHGDPRIAFALGVHPLILGFKHLVLHPWCPLYTRSLQYRYEYYYAAGARDARWEHEPA